jgi:hypothetical protein
MPFMPVVPIPFFGGIFQLFFLLMVVSVVFNVVKGFAASASKDSKSKNDEWGDL